jgi:hypothetical protein
LCTIRYKLHKTATHFCLCYTARKKYFSKCRPRCLQDNRNK